MRVVFAPDSFKGTVGAAGAARALAQGWAAARPDDDLLCLPMADGGEGTIDAILAAEPAGRLLPVTVRGPDGVSRQARWLLLPGDVGVVELAETSGLTLLPSPEPFRSQTDGFGQAVEAALRHGVRRLLLAIGGSASTDGGTGMLRALGARFLDRAGEPVVSGGAGLAEIERADLTRLLPLPPEGVAVLSDVTNPLYGPEGAAAVYGEQKGADRSGRELLDAGLRRLARILGPERAAEPGAGAAGGTGYGLLVWGDHAAARGEAALARPPQGKLTLVQGSRTIAETIGLPAAAADADVLVTGEGRFDGQSASGKVPSLVASLATRGLRCLVAGSIAAEPAGLFDVAVSLADLAGDPRTARAEPVRWLQRAGGVLAGMAASRV